MADNPFEIPQTLRDASEQNLKHAHAAYEQLMAFVTKAMGAWTGALPSKSHGRCLQGCTRPHNANRDGKCRVGFHVRRQDHQRTDLPRYCDASDAVCSRPHVLVLLPLYGSSIKTRGPCRLSHSQDNFCEFSAKQNPVGLCATGLRRLPCALYVARTQEAKPSVQKVMTDLRIRALTPSPIVQASGNQSSAPKGADGCRAA